MKNSMDFSKIEVNGKLLGVLNFNLMIPIEEDQLQLVDTTIFKRDRENIRYYKKLCTLELEWCQMNNEVICNKANVLYKKYLSNEPFAGRIRFKVVAGGKKPIVRSGKLLAWVLSVCMLILSYSFVFQSKYDVARTEIGVDQNTHELDNENTYIIKQQDGSYILHGENNDISIDEENAKKLIQDGFIMIEGE